MVLGTGNQPGHMSQGVARVRSRSRRLEHAASDLRKETRKYNFSGELMLRCLLGSGGGGGGGGGNGCCLCRVRHNKKEI